MLRRARRLRNTIDKYCRDHEYSQFKVTDTEWRQIDYLVNITRPFFKFTMALMKTKDVTIHSVFLVYRKLLEHIERSNRKLRKKTTPWKKDMYGAMLMAKQKLKDYYEKTYRDHGFLYGTAALLAPQYKLCAFDDTEYSQCIGETSKRYCEYLRSSFAQYQQRNPEMLFRAVQRPSLQASELERLLEPTHAVETSEGVGYDEVDRYLHECKYIWLNRSERPLTFPATTSIPPRVYWRENESKFPVLSRLARDLLSVPATGAGVERLFNSARDICHYRRGSLNETTIQDLMMYMCSEKFTLESQQSSLLDHRMAEGEDQENLEENEANKETEDENAAISDIDESDLVEDTDMSPTVQSVLGFESTASQELPSHSRPQDVTMTAIRPDPESDDEDLLPPPVTHLGERYQKRSSGRMTVPSSRLEGYELY
jgi:hypothetical protein